MIRKVSAGDGSELKWFKSSYSSNGSEGDCVEVASTPAAVHVRDSKNDPATGAVLAITPGAWTAFLGARA
ncbi:DUF397 domain-containing protein [Streptomyces sp. NBC_01465]|uniref:DUF397 domain-containing protein n=1 Tax=Streptomyces sp. NBC_01465 TaxID=2903878 RepID=UPI002E306C1E|nr:DUF397 domain-containing protein [Streptomyces sp. NBC_01465]